ncbi:sensor histidine kinase [Streptomyces endophyticus]|uniref:histidine kinase n=1 Tax=Streptomyces endophyticus TaxID=714166 RepID=A0ABU6F9U1_9ACTN|nr:sensor domain-containing protein [Streptomyces endophyticus]MEB8340810.1 sensor domain-containing protein [Streptomyces endophyticus]
MNPAPRPQPPESPRPTPAEGDVGRGDKAAPDSSGQRRRRPRGPVRGLLRTVVGSPGEAAYGLLAPLPGFLCGLVLLSLLASGLITSVVLVGLLPLIAVPFVARGTGAVHRALVNRLLGERIQPPPRRPRPPGGLLERARAALTDAGGWRCAAFTLAFLPVGALLVMVFVMIRLYGLITLTYPIWWWLVRSDDGRRGLGLGFGGIQLDTWPTALLTGLAGLLPMALATWCTRWLLDLAVRPMARALLGPGRLDARVHELEDTRALVVQDSAATLRRIERDLHDGAQARMIAVAMTLARARERLARLPGAEPELASGRELVDTALAESRTAIGELRDLVRGIHPPALNDGLDVALETLAALPLRPPEAIESIAYFCAAELLANATRHSRATAVRIGARSEATPAGGLLRLTVADDGHGGAHPRREGATRGAGGTGLAGLAERVSTVDGQLLIDSPDGGPTTITVELPFPAQGLTPHRTP